MYTLYLYARKIFGVACFGLLTWLALINSSGYRIAMWRKLMKNFIYRSSGLEIGEA